MSCMTCDGWESRDADEIEAYGNPGGFYIVSTKDGKPGIAYLGNDGVVSERSMVADFCPVCGERLGDGE